MNERVEITSNPALNCSRIWSERRPPWSPDILTTAFKILSLIVVVGLLLEVSLPSSAALPTEARANSALSEHRVSVTDELANMTKAVAHLENEETKFAQQVLQDFPNNADAYVLIGTACGWHGNYTEALNFWEKALKINPRQPDIYRKMGLVVWEKEEPDKAITLWEKALEIDPCTPGVRWNMALAMVTMGKHQQAAKLLEQEIHITPNAARNYFLLGQAYLQLREYEKAKKNYQKTIELAPKHFSAYYGLSNACARLKEIDKAQEYMATFNKLRTPYHDVQKQRQDVDEIPKTSKRIAILYMDAAKIYQGVPNPQKAEELLKKAIAADPDSTLYREKLAALYYTSNRTREALDIFEKIGQMDPNNPFSHLNIGQASSELGMFDRAERAFRRALALSPNQPAGYRQLARLYLRSNKNLFEARKLAEKAVSLEAVADNYFILCWACDITGDPASALKAIEQAIKFEPHNLKYRSTYERIKSRK